MRLLELLRQLPPPGDELPDDAAAEEPAPEDEEATEEGPLLAEPEPAQRDDSYKPVALDKRRSGARKRSALAAAGEKAAYPGRTRLFKGDADGLGPLSRGIVSAGVTKDEELIVETKNDIKKLINQLENIHEEKT